MRTAQLLFLILHLLWLLPGCVPTWSQYIQENKLPYKFFYANDLPQALDSSQYTFTTTDSAYDVTSTLGGPGLTFEREGVAYLCELIDDRYLLVTQQDAHSSGIWNSLRYETMVMYDKRNACWYDVSVDEGVLRLYASLEFFEHYAEFIPASRNNQHMFLKEIKPDDYMMVVVNATGHEKVWPIHPIRLSRVIGKGGRKGVASG